MPKKKNPKRNAQNEEQNKNQIIELEKQKNQFSKEYAAAKNEFYAQIISENDGLYKEILDFLNQENSKEKAPLVITISHEQLIR